MFQWLFGKSNKATRAEDSVWMSSPARLKGVRLEVERFVSQNRSVVIVALTLPALEELARELVQHQPVLCRDVFGHIDLRGQMARGATVAVALAGALPAEVTPGTNIQVEILVYGRHDTRAADESILRFADLLGPSARVTFHLSLDDTMLKDYTGSLKPLLARLNFSEEEAMSSPMVTRAIVRIQSKKAS